MRENHGPGHDFRSRPLTSGFLLRGRTAPSRVLFGPHETNLGRGRRFSDRHAAYYGRRAAGGAGVIVTEVASVHDSDWPYERAPLAAHGWGDVLAACRPHGALVLAGLGHAGGQGSSAHHQEALWAPSRVPDVVTREVPMAVEQPEIDALVAGFGAAAALAAAADLDGVEVNAGQHSILRQFLSGLTNRRTDGYGRDRPRLLREVLAAVRAALGEDRVLGLRLCCDELAPWAGITPDDAVSTAAGLAPAVDYLVPVRGSALSVEATRPDLHTEPEFNRALCARVRAAAGVPTVLQGSVVDPISAQAALDAGVADLVEMTRAQITDPDLVAHVRAGRPERVRPCTLSNQRSAVRDPRNPLVSDDIEPHAGHELDGEWPLPRDPVVGGPAVSDPASGGPASGGPAPQGPAPHGSVPQGSVPRRSASKHPAPKDSVPPDSTRRDRVPREVLVVGGGPAGLEAARTAALRGLRVRLVERAAVLGGALRLAAAVPGRARMGLPIDWWRRELRRSGVQVDLRTEVSVAELDAADAVVLATGSRPAPPSFSRDGPVLAAGEFEAAVLAAGSTAAVLGPHTGTVVVHDPVGDWSGVGVAEQVAAAGWPVVLVTPDPVAGTQLGRTGDLAPATVRLARAGVRRELLSRLCGVRDGVAALEHVWTGERRTVDCALVIDCDHRLPADELWRARPHLPRAGDCVAPRTIHEAVLEGRRAVAEAVRADAVLPARP